MKTKVVCLSCAATNNYPSDTGQRRVVCGRCKTELPLPGRVIEPSPAQTENLMNRSSLPILIDFYSPTCAPCQRMLPAVEGLAQRRAGELMVIKINVDSHPQLASIFGIQGVPTFVIVRQGHERDRMSGALSETDFSLWVASRV